MIRVLSSLFLLSFWLFAVELKISSYNVENLFDMVNNGTEYDEYKPKKHNWSRSNFKKKLLNISDVICDINADIIGLQEIENENVLKLLQKSLRSVGCYYNYSAITHKQYSAIQVAILSKLPIKSKKEIRVNKKLIYRNILEVKFIIEHQPLYIYVNHWSSKHSAESSRLLSARVLRKRLDSLPKGSEYILLGDFNSDYSEYRDMEPQHNDTHGKTGINHILKTTYKGYLVQKREMLKKSNLHYNLWLEISTFHRWSHNFYGKKQALDSIILPSTLFDGKGLEYVDESFKVFKPSYLFHKKGYIYRWKFRNGKHEGRGYSDHLPIVAIFSTKRYEHKKRVKYYNEGIIDELYLSNPTIPVLLKNIKVILRSSHYAIVKQRRDGRAIFVYGAEGLEEGKAYDIVVKKTKLYHGLHEITNFYLTKRYGKTEIETLFYRGGEEFSKRALENDVFKELMGFYREGKFYIDGKGYKIFFKKRHLEPKNGSKLKLHRVQIGYYDTMQLVIWDAKDFTIVE